MRTLDERTDTPEAIDARHDRWLLMQIEDARRRNAEREADAQRQGGTYDPILRKWIPWNETGPVR